mgnify:CR=1 FL=1
MIRKTFEMVKGLEKVIITLNHPVSDFYLEQVSEKLSEEIAEKKAKKCAQLMKKLSQSLGDACILGYCPEGFTAAKPEWVLSLMESVLSVWKNEKERKILIRLDDSAEETMSHVYATFVEFFHKRLKDRQKILLNICPHNDRGCAVSDAELGILAGADMVEGALFGNGDRAGGTDLITLSMNLLAHGTDSCLDLCDLMGIRSRFEKLTGVILSDRTPYIGDLVFAPYEGYRQQAVKRGLEHYKEMPERGWRVPYLTVDPMDVGRLYTADMDRLNMRSAKNSPAYILKQNFGLSLPDGLKKEVMTAIREGGEREYRDLSPEMVYQFFEDTYIHNNQVFTVKEHHFKQLPDGILSEVTIALDDKEQSVTANGNGRLSAVSNAIKQYFNLSFELTVYEEHSLSKGSSSKAVTYVGISCQNKLHWGVGIHEDIIVASINALVAALNKLEEIQSINACTDPRMLEIQNYIQSNYLTVTLEELSEHFYLSKPYLSKYIREKSGSTFGELVKKVRMRKARTLLKNRNVTVESIAESVGYQNVEHFNRLFKKAYGMTPIQYRNHK